jgi:hypothetical protein
MMMSGLELRMGLRTKFLEWTSGLGTSCSYRASHH